MDRNSEAVFTLPTKLSSPPARVAWIETFGSEPFSSALRVATREGGVDRNPIFSIRNQLTIVATREGGVDRNVKSKHNPVNTWTVATREGGVDRNIDYAVKVAMCDGSPPARVAWIETSDYGEDIDNCPSPPARVAWIETLTRPSLLTE